MDSKLNRNLLIGFSISLFILIASSIASYLSIKNLLNSSKLVEHTNSVVSELNETLSDLKDAETGQRGFLLTGADAFLEPYNGSLGKVEAHLTNLKYLTVDNKIQQERIAQLDVLVKKRFSKLEELIQTKRSGNPIDIKLLYNGKSFMDSVRVMVKSINNREQELLKERVAEQNRFSSYTPALILIAALLAIIITIVFYLKVKRDLKERALLTQMLERKDEEINKRIIVIKQIAAKISSGDFSVRVDDRDDDSLGSISGSLNSMAENLEKSFRALDDQQWLQKGVTLLNNEMIGDNDLQRLTEKIMAFIADYTESLVGALYIAEADDSYKLQNGFALNQQLVAHSFYRGEGLTGQVAASNKMLVVESPTNEGLTISYASGNIMPVSIVIFPVVFEGAVKAVIELGALSVYGDRDKKFFKLIGENIGIAINTVQNRQRVQELLEETQSQSEELMTQQSELEQVNAELELQSQQLQTSEEELKVQSEELLETNSLLEERAGMLEQQNELIIQKNAEIQKRSEDLAMSTRYKSEFLANMSHELRTPLNSILLLSRLMAENSDENLTDDQVQYAKVIQSSGNGLLQLIDEILDLSKIEAGKMSIEYLPVQLEEIIGDAAALFEPLAHHNNITWKRDIHSNVPVEIETDKFRVGQVLKNLLSNAFKFTKKGGVELTVNCPENRPGFICFIVKDSGTGIAAEKLDLIFEAFQQEDGSTRRKFGGTGLGLSISRELAKLLGGEVTVSSKLGQGSEFVLCIPTKHSIIGSRPVTEYFLPTAPRNLSPATNSYAPNTHSPNDKKYHTDIIPEEIPDDRNSLAEADKILLIIEDDTNFAKSLLEYARQKGYKGLVAVQGDVGLQLAKSYPVSGILLDIQLPVKNGWEVLEALKKDVHTRHIPVHIMSSFEVKKESLMGGAIDFINKPVPYEMLHTIFDKIEYVLSNKGQKVLIIEENYKHAKALGYYLGTYGINTEIHQQLPESIEALEKPGVDGVIFDPGISSKNYEEMLENIKQQKGLENMPIILFTGKSLTQPEEFKIRKYADAIVLKTANSYQRILDEVTLFLHLVQEQESKKGHANFEKSILQDNVLKGKTILLADDDVRNIFSLTKALEKYGLKIIPAMDGKEALDLLVANASTDIVLMDIMMPNMDGYESIKAIRKINKYKGLPVIAITAKAMSGDREKCIAAGASDYISKPVDMDQLVSLLRIWLYDRGY